MTTWHPPSRWMRSAPASVPLLRMVPSTVRSQRAITVIGPPPGGCSAPVPGERALRGEQSGDGDRALGGEKRDGAAGHGLPSAETTEPAWVVMLVIAVRLTLPPLPPAHEPAFWFEEMMAPWPPSPASRIVPVAVISMVAPMPWAVFPFVTLPVILASGSMTKWHTAGVAQTVMVSDIAVGGRQAPTILPPSRM